MEAKLIALALFVIILIYFNYRRYKRLQEQRALLQSARNGLIFGHSCGRRSISISATPRHQIAIIFPPSSSSASTIDISNSTSISIPNDLPPSYQDLFADDTAARTRNPNVLPTYRQIMSNHNNNNPTAQLSQTQPERY